MNSLPPGVRRVSDGSHQDVRWVSDECRMGLEDLCELALPPGVFDQVTLAACCGCLYAGSRYEEGHVWSDDHIWVQPMVI